MNRLKDTLSRMPTSEVFNASDVQLNTSDINTM